MKELKQLTQYKTTCQTHNQGDSVLIRVQQQLLALGVTIRSNGLRIPLNDKRDRSKADVRLPLAPQAHPGTRQAYPERIDIKDSLEI